jgi:D-3-phosphoglycerate dehydrogenase
MLRGAFPAVTLLGNDLTPDTAFGRDCGVEWVDKDTLYRRSDVITLHVPLTRHTRYLVAREQIELMKTDAFLLNTARGGLVKESDLAEALMTGRLAGAAVDTFEREPYDGPLKDIPQCLLTCHMGSMSEDCRTRMEVEAVEEAIRFLRGQSLQQAVPEAEYAMRVE